MARSIVGIFMGCPTLNGEEPAAKLPHVESISSTCSTRDRRIGPGSDAILARLRRFRQGAAVRKPSPKTHDAEALTLDRKTIFSFRTEVADALAPLDLDVCLLDTALRNAFRNQLFCKDLPHDWEEQRFFLGFSA
ncbi:MAG: hypothetical protein WAK01_06940 [Methylocystis sp.]